MTDVTGGLARGRADEVALLLAAEGIDGELVDASDGTHVAVRDLDAARARRVLVEEYPDGVGAARAAVPQPLGADRWFGPGSWVVFAVLAVTVGVFLAEEAAGGSTERAVLLRFGASRPAQVRTGEWWRLFTAIFVHIGARHLLANAATLLVLGPALASALGPLRFACVYLAAGTLGNVVSYWVADPDVVSAGASGAILGVLGALGGQRIRFAASARFRGWQVVAALLAYLGIAVGAGPGVDTMAHVGGLIAGFVLGLVVPPPARTPLRASPRA